MGFIPPYVCPICFLDCIGGSQYISIGLENFGFMVFCLNESAECKLQGWLQHRENVPTVLCTCVIPNTVNSEGEWNWSKYLRIHNYELKFIEYLLLVLGIHNYELKFIEYLLLVKY